MKERYKSKTEEQAASHVAEECAEVLHAFTKAQRFGWQSVNPELIEGPQETNHQWFMREIADLQEAIKALTAYHAAGGGE